MTKSPEHARLLLEKAAEDLYALERMAGDPQAPDSIIGFHAQQAVEKFLKAVLTNRGVSYGRTHDLGQLLELLKKHARLLPPDAEQLLDLTPFAVEFRYGRLPAEPEDLEPFDPQAALSLVLRIQAWAESHLA